MCINADLSVMALVVCFQHIFFSENYKTLFVVIEKLVNSSA